jgi:glycopeptide antibiotics resistance protein
MKLRAALIALVAYVVVLALLVLWPTHPEAFLQPQLITLTLNLAAHPATAWITFGVLNFVANVVLFAPLTLLGVLVFGRAWWFLIFAAGAAAAAAAELAQDLFLPGRTADIFDIIAGSVGSLLGALIGVAIVRRRGQKNEAPSPDGTGE